MTYVACARLPSLCSSCSRYLKFADELMLAYLSNVMGSIKQDESVVTLLRVT